MTQTVRRVAVASLLASIIALPFPASAQAVAERKIEGTVLRTKVTVCEMRARGCAGYLILETAREGRPAQVMVQVRLGVPIRQGDDYVYLPTLGGSTIAVIYITEKGAVIARSIMVVKPAASSSGARTTG